MLGATTACMPKHVHTSTVETNALGNTEALRLASKARTQKKGIRVACMAVSHHTLPPSIPPLRVTEHAGAAELKLGEREVLSQAVSNHELSRDILKGNLIAGNPLACKMVQHINVLGTGRTEGVLQQRESSLVVASNANRTRDGNAQIKEKAAEPKCLTGGSGAALVLSLSSGGGDSGLEARVPGDGRT